ncbi:Protein ccc1 [Lodderomyces elongisporus]|uniref:Protein CCC1 n=1 Tax=Lodderomyces elongisporus (strain ATCC 11503 / CBS 2605 / JCM 1781 / NBRC 1676 / NRRL YB-4239) TaxID=379508 RepID=A5DZH7_LODEL|nr:Protein ccc1 [Lodderomyces elongisporus]EDK44585.1 protein CCC1 [Lodderomyces elongisporus NRRL YB-4239]WLF79842.1 Protein ccc1 [Lodderomyces elongisporus]
MSLVALKNGVASLLNHKNKSDEEINRVNRLLENNQGPYGSTDNDATLTPQDDRAAEVARQEAVMNAAESVASSSDNKEDEEVDANFLTKFFSRFDPRVMSDIIIGLSDGLTVPFALTAGLSSLGDSKLVITGGMAELVSGAISMGLGGYLAAKSESEYYTSQVKKEKLDFFKRPESINQDAAEILFELGASEATIISFLKDLDSQPKNLIDFVIRFGKGLEEPAEGREFTSALTIGLSYFFGGFVPLLPYFFTHVVKTGLLISVIVMLITLFIFGYIKTQISLGDDCGNRKKIAEGFQMVAVGSVAAGAAWGLVYFIDN